MYTSLVERTPGAGRHANLSAGVASARAINCWETCFHSPSYPCQIPSGALANDIDVLNKSHSKNAFRNRLFMSSSSEKQLPYSSLHGRGSQQKVYSMAVNGYMLCNRRYADSKEARDMNKVTSAVCRTLAYAVVDATTG